MMQRKYAVTVVVDVKAFSEETANMIVEDLLTESYKSKHIVNWTIVDTCEYDDQE